MGRAELAKEDGVEEIEESQFPSEWFGRGRKTPLRFADTVMVAAADP